MADRNDSGQVLLISAILFVVVIILITLMLNNIIFATNVAYMGFMDGSKYEDLSIRKLTTSEAHYSFQVYPSYVDDSIDHDNPRLINRTRYMGDYEKAINYLTNSKGKYVELEDTYYTSPDNSLVTTQTKWGLVITNMDSRTNYSLQTGSWDPDAPHPPSHMPKPSASLGSATYNVSEGGAVTITVNLSYIYDYTVTVDYATQSGTALPSSDYISASGSVTFAPGELEKTFTITTVQDSVYETPESFTVSLTGFTNANAATDGSPITATINVIDDDPAAPPTPTPAVYKMTVSCTADRQATGNQKRVTITAVVENTGTSALTGIKLSLTSPVGKTLVSGANPAPTLSTLNPGSTYTYTWVIETQNQHDLVNVRIKAIANEIPGGVSSDTLMNI